MLLVIGVALVMALGLVGTVIPGVPGLLVIFGAAAVFGFVEGFGTPGTVALVVMGALVVAGTLASYLLPHRAGVVAGMGRASLRMGIVGAIVGMIVIPVLGLPIGAVLGVLVAEQRRLGDWSAAWRTTSRVAVGFGLGALAEIGAGMLMIITWIGWLIAR